MQFSHKINTAKKKNYVTLFMYREFCVDFVTEMLDSYFRRLLVYEYVCFFVGRARFHVKLSVKTRRIKKNQVLFLSLKVDVPVLIHGTGGVRIPDIFFDK